MKYINSTKDNVKNLNTKQTVIVEDIDENGKKSRNVYAGNFKRRQDAFYLGMEGMKATRKGETKKSYRLLKLGKLLAEVGKKGYNTKTSYLIAEEYSQEPVVYTKPAAEEVTEEPAVALAE